jgi:hypothetical protein
MKRIWVVLTIGWLFALVTAHAFLAWWIYDAWGDAESFRLIAGTVIVFGGVPLAYLTGTTLFLLWLATQRRAVGWIFGLYGAAVLVIASVILL